MRKMSLPGPQESMQSYTEFNVQREILATKHVLTADC